MYPLDFSRKAAQAIRELPKDSVLLRQLWRRLERIAEDPASHTEPSCFPYPPGRLMANFSIEDGRKATWGVTVTLRIDSPDYRVHVLTLIAAPAPYLDDDTINPS